MVNVRLVAEVRGVPAVRVWKEFLADVALAGLPGGAAVGLVAAGDRPRSASKSKKVYAIDPSDGSIVWQINTSGDVTSDLLVLSNGNVCVGQENSTLLCLNPSNGSIIWSASFPTSTNNGLATDSYNRLFFAGDRKVFCLDGNTGTLLWEKEHSDYVTATPVADNYGNLYYGSHDTYFYSVKAFDGSVNWSFKTTHRIKKPCAFGLNEKIYFGSNGRIYCLNRNTGGLIWDKAIGGGEVISSAAVDQFGDLYIGRGNPAVGSNDGKFFKIDGENGNVIWSFSSGDSYFSSSPVIGDNLTVYIGNMDGTFYAINGSTGIEIWNHSSSSSKIQSFTG